MKTAKLIVMYPQPADLDEFEQRYTNEHVPMAVEKLAGKTRFVASLITSSVGSKEPAPFHRIAEVYFPSMQVLEECLNSPGGQETAGHAVEISTGGAPLFLIAEVESFDF
ncbi:MAG: EthD family reductase [Methylococcales bacterium]|nr:EthD family reductase [Methylococcales bacterium]